VALLSQWPCLGRMSPLRETAGGPPTLSHAHFPTFRAGLVSPPPHPGPQGGSSWVQLPQPSQSGRRPGRGESREGGIRATAQSCTLETQTFPYVVPTRDRGRYPGVAGDDGHTLGDCGDPGLQKDRCPLGSLPNLVDRQRSLHCSLSPGACLDSP
jgi:hypothetical protein